MTPTKNITLKQIAELAGCSTAVVSTVLNNSRSTLNVSEETRQRVRSIASQHNYRPHLAARMMKSRKSWQVGVLLLNTHSGLLAHPSVFEIVQGINEGLERAGYLTSLIRIGDIENENDVSTRLFEGHLLDGLIVVNIVPETVIGKIKAAMQNLNLPCIWVDTNVWQQQNCIRRDEYDAGVQAANALMKMGFEKIIVTERPHSEENHFSFAERLRGVKDALSYHAEVEWVQMPFEHGFHEIFELSQHLDPSVGVLTLDAYGAQKLIVALSTLRLSAGYDYGLVCCDDSERPTENPWPGLCRVSFNRYEMGVQAAKMLLCALQLPEGGVPSQLAKGHWIIGNTAWNPR